MEVFQGIKGHSIKSYKKLISSIVLKNIDVTYEWFSLENNKPRKRTITKDYAKKVLEILNKKSELSKEIKEFTGYLLQADTEKGTWRINNLEDKKEYSGTSKIEIKLLSGVTLETQLYKLICEEIIEENNLNHNEKVKYKLNKIILIQ